MSGTGYRTAFITGASSGIGEMLARRLASEGVDVALAARRRDRLEELAQEIREQGGKVRTYPLDVSDPEQTTATVQRADDEMGGLDLVVANAGVGRVRWAGKLTWEQVAPSIQINVSGAVATLLAVLPRMVKRGRGHLVGVSSLAGYRAMPRTAAYSASKAYLIHFLEGLRVDLHSTGVDVTDVQPGFVHTPMTAGNQRPMPFALEPDEATQIILRGLRRRSPVIAFPWQLAAMVRSSQIVPGALWERASRAPGMG